MAMAFCTRRRHRPDLRIPVQRGVDRPRQAGGIVVIEHHAGALPGLRIEVLHRVGQPAGAAHDRDGAVAQAVHLVEAAGLVLRGHQEHVAGGLDPVRVFLAVATAKGHARRMLMRQLARGTARSAASPLPSTARQNSRSASRRGSASIIRSSPFCEARRLTMPISGRRLRAWVASPARCRNSCLSAALVPSWLALKCCGRKRSLRGSHSW